jgi:hypothetical protein
MKSWKTLLAVAGFLDANCALALGGLADLSVHDRTEGRQLAVHWHEGRAYVVGKPGNEYQVTLRSRWHDEVLTVVSIDGINVITGQSADPAQSGYVLAPRGALEIRGWRKSLAQTAAFYFTPLPDSYAARAGRPDDVGVIGVALFRKKQEPQPIGQFAPLAKSEARAADQSLGTGHGRREDSPARYVSFERATSAPEEVVTLYYDSYRNLLARGVIRQPAPVAPLPRPFPDFVPDPRG